MKRAIAAFAVVVAGLSAAAKTNYVDCSLGDYTGHNGRSWEKAFETIQQAIDAGMRTATRTLTREPDAADAVYDDAADTEAVTYTYTTEAEVTEEGAMTKCAPVKQASQAENSAENAAGAQPEMMYAVSGGAFT